MVKVASLFSQILHHFPRHEFAALVKKHYAERNCKGFPCWSQFVAMIFSQLARADSLREIRNGPRCCLGKLVHRNVSSKLRHAFSEFSVATCRFPPLSPAG